MKTDITFYLAGGVEENLPIFTASGSPFRLTDEMDGAYRLDSKDPVFSHFFTLLVPDSEVFSETQVCQEAQQALDFQVNSELFHGNCHINPEKVAALSRVMEYIIRNEVPCYMTATNEEGFEVLVRGYNPLTGVEIENPNFERKLRGTLE